MPPNGNAVWCALPSACLRARELFAQPYLQHRVPLAFRHGDGAVSAVSGFGLRPQDDSRFASLRQQARLLFRTGSSCDGSLELAVDLCADSAEQQLVVARSERPKDLMSGWQRVVGRQAGSRPIDSREVLLVPDVCGRVTEADIELCIDRGGEQVGSELAAILGGPQTLVFDRPFLLAAKKRSEDQPYLLMWIDDDALLQRFDESTLPDEPAPPDHHRMVEAVGDAAIKTLEGRDNVYSAYFVADSGAQWREHLTREELTHCDLFVEMLPDSLDAGVVVGDFDTARGLSAAQPLPTELVVEKPPALSQREIGKLIRLLPDGEAWQGILRRNSLAIGIRGATASEVRLIAVRRSPRRTPELTWRYVRHPEVQRREDQLHLVSFSWGEPTTDQITSGDLRQDNLLVEVTGTISPELRKALPKALAVASWNDIGGVLTGSADGVVSTVLQRPPEAYCVPSGVGEALLLRIEKHGGPWEAIVSGGTLAMFLRGFAEETRLALVAQKCALVGA